MPDDATLRITTLVDTSQLEAGMQKATAATQQYTNSATLGFNSVKEAEAALAEAQEMLGQSASQGNAQAASIIAEYEGAVAAAKAAVDQETIAVEENTAVHRANNEVIRNGISERMAASAAVRTLEGGMQGSVRAAENFLVTGLQLGPVLQAAFPVIGAIAFGEVIARIGERVYEFYQNFINLKAEIAAFGQVSEKTSKEAADANWKYIESQVEMLKNQGKLKEAQQFLAVHAGEKPVSLSLGIDKKALEDLPTDVQKFADRISNARTQIQAEPLFGEMAKQQVEAKAKIEAAEKELEQLKSMYGETAIAAAGAIGGYDPSRLGSVVKNLNAQVTAYTEYYNGLQNLQNKNVSEAAADERKRVDDQAAILRQQQTLDQASLESRKTVTAAKIAQDEELARRQLQLGEITEQQELARLASDTQKKLQLEIDYYTQLDAILSRDADKNTAEITRNQGRIQALKIQQHTEQLKAQQEADAAELQELLRSIDIQIQATKTGSSERVELIREEVEIVGEFYNFQGEEYQKMLAKLSAADRERTAELQRQTLQQVELQLRGVKEQAAAEQQASDQAVRDKQRELDESNRVQQQQLSQQARQGSRFGIIDIGQVEASFQRMKDAEAKYTEDSIALAQQAAQAKIDAQEKVIEAAELAALSSNDPKFLEQAQAAADKQVAIEQELQSKLTQLRQQGADRARQIDDQLAQAKFQEEQRITNRMLSFEDQALFHSKSFSQAVQNLYRNLAESGINSLLQLANRWIAEHLIMELATRLFHIHNTATAATANAQQVTQTITTNAATVTSEAAVAAAKAYAAYAYFPPLAAAMAAEAEATVLSFLPEAAAEGGFDVPFGSSPLTQLHPQEMVLPDHLANTVRNMAQIAPKLAAPSFAFPGLPEAAAGALRGDFGGSITNNFNRPGGEESGGDFHFHAGDVHASALDRSGVGDILKRHGADVAKSVMRLAKAGHFNRR